MELALLTWPPPGSLLRYMAWETAFGGPCGAPGLWGAPRPWGVSDWLRLMSVLGSHGWLLGPVFGLPLGRGYGVEARGEARSLC